MKKTGGSSVTADFGSRNVLSITRSVIRRGPTCDHCIGRQLARVSTGMTNDERGKIVRKNIGAPAKKGKCIVCGDIFRRLGDFADSAAGRLKKLEFSTFLVGTLMSPALIAAEESLWEDVGIEYCEPIRSELNRELGKLIYARIRKEVDEKTPDVTLLLNLAKDRTDIMIRSLFVKGLYRKLVRGIPQTKWDKYDETVEDIIAAPFMKVTGGDGHSLHAAGREDIDARCLDGRQFVLEIENPVRRSVNLKEMASDVAKTKKVEVLDLAFTDRKEVPDVKSLRNDKSYSVVVEFSKAVREKDMGKLSSLVGTVSQRTPERVAHRRADLVRKRDVHSITWRRINNKNFELQIKGEAGLYIKELVTGDGGRTKPSVSETLGNPAKVKSLDVIKIWKG